MQIQIYYWKGREETNLPHRVPNNLGRYSSLKDMNLKPSSPTWEWATLVDLSQKQSVEGGVM